MPPLELAWGLKFVPLNRAVAQEGVVSGESILELLLEFAKILEAFFGRFVLEFNNGNIDASELFTH